MRMLRLLLMSAVVALPQELPTPVKEAITVLDSWVQAKVAEREQPGLSIGIVHDQRLVWAKGYGFADLEKKIAATPATSYRIASISKLFTATALLQLRDAGKLGMDDAVAEHLDWFDVKSRFHDTPGITIWHLITHTSGLPRESPVPYWNTKQFPSREEMIAMLAKQEAVFAPETEWKYSNLALAIAGEVVQSVSGEPYAAYIEGKILKPLGMTATRVLPQPGQAGLAAGYLRRAAGQARQPEEFTHTKGIAPAANLSSNVEDLAKFMMLQFRDGKPGGAQILRGATLREMQRIHWLRPDWRGGSGLGFQIRRAGSQTRVGHGGSLGGYRTQIEFVPEDKLGVIVLTNSNDGDPMLYVDQAFQIAGPAIVKALAKPKPAPKPDPKWDKYTGAYTWRNEESMVIVIEGQLCVVTPAADNPWETRTRLEPVTEHTFRMKGGASPGELLRFEMDAAGNVTRMWAGSGFRDRKK